MGWNEEVTEAVKLRMEANQPIWSLIRTIKRDSSIGEEMRRSLLSELYGSLSDKDVKQELVSDTLFYDVGTSFRSSVNDLRRLKKRMQSVGYNIFPGGNPKLKDRDFASSLNVRVPRTFARNTKFADIVLFPESILKPVNGASSRGVFYVDYQSRLHSIKSGIIYDSIQAAREEIDQYKNSISADRWMSEEAILGPDSLPSNDLKVYSFYGTHGLFLEIRRQSETGSHSAAEYATYDESGHQIELGPGYKSFPGDGVPDDIREMATKLSLASPVPFLRLDFHQGINGSVLGEITPHPGGTYAGELFDKVDRRLGALFEDAKARLFIDLFNGKEFPEFCSAYGVQTQR